MEVIIHPKSKVKVGDILRVSQIHEDRFDVATLSYVRSAVLENAEQSMHQTAFGAGWRGRLGEWLVSLGNRIAQSGGR